jgi:putative ABC transport system ATP-binding protein
MMSLVLEGIRKSFREPDGTPLPILEIERFQIDRAEQVVLVGSSGGGKTTLLNVVAGITTPDAGQVVIDGVDITRLPEVGRDRFRADHVGIVFQTFNLLPAFSALENVLLGMSFARGRVDRQHAMELLKRVGLERRLDHRPGQLSVGEQQRVAVARALANSPTLLLADEPTASIDVTHQEAVLTLIREICGEQNVAILLVTHSHDVASQFERVEELSQFNKVAAGR